MGIFRTFESGEHKQNRSHIQNLVSVALADGKIDENEMAYLEILAQEYSVTSEELQNMIVHPDHYVFTAPMNKEERFTQLKEIIRILISDGKVGLTEINICKKYAVALNYNPSTVLRLTNYLQSLVDQPFELYSVITKLEDIID